MFGEWTCPDNIIAAVRKQSLTREEDYEDRLACLLNLACGMIAADGHFIIGEKRHWEITFLKVASLGLEMEQLKKIEERARKAFAAYRKTTGFAPDEAEDTPPVPSTAPQPSSTSVQSAHASQAAKPANPARPAKRQWWRESYAQWPLAVRCTFLFASAGLAQVTFTTAAWVLAGFDSPQFVRTFATPIAWFHRSACLADSLGDFLGVVFRAIPPLVAVMYVALFALAVTTAYRISKRTADPVI